MHDPRHTCDAQTIAAKLLEAAGRIAPTIARRRTPSAHEIAQIMDASFATGHTHRGWSPRDAEEACEIAIVKDLLSTPLDLEGSTWTEWHTLNRIDDLAGCEPRHHARTEEQRRHQHFSTPWTIGYVMVQAAELHPGDLVLEPSAGLGSLIALARATAPRVRWHINELEPVRHEVLKVLFPEATHTAVDALTLADAPDIAVRPFDAVLMNPPFSRDATRGRRRTALDIHHVAAATALVRPRGRIVALTTNHAHPGHPVWDREITQTRDATTLWSKSLDASLYKHKGVAPTTRMSVVEPHSTYTYRPWTSSHDEHYDDPAELLGSVLTELGGRTDGPIIHKNSSARHHRADTPRTSCPIERPTSSTAHDPPAHTMVPPGSRVAEPHIRIIE